MDVAAKARSDFSPRSASDNSRRDRGVFTMFEVQLIRFTSSQMFCFPEWLSSFASSWVDDVLIAHSLLFNLFSLFSHGIGDKISTSVPCYFHFNYDSQVLFDRFCFMFGFSRCSGSDDTFGDLSRESSLFDDVEHRQLRGS